MGSLLTPGPEPGSSGSAQFCVSGHVICSVAVTPVSICVRVQLICVLEQTGLQTEGILRVPGSAARLKVTHAQGQVSFTD